MIPGVPSNYQNPTRYVGPNARIIPIVTGNRRPDVNDINYLLGTIWRVGKNPSSGAEGEYWILSLLDNTGATWIPLAVAAGMLTSLRADDGNTAAPAGGIIDVRGLDVSAMSVPIRTTSTLANTLDINIQRSSAGMSGNPQLCGICYFDSSQFTVDANGFVQLGAGGVNVTQFTTDDGNMPVPTAGGNFNVLSAVVANGANPSPIFTDGSVANTATIEIQRSTANVAAMPTLAGISYFDNTQFTVTADGFVSLIGTGAAMTNLVADDGNTIIPNAMGEISVIGTTVVNATNPKPLFTDGSVANVLDAQLQIATASAAADVNLAGICYFDNTQFTVDAITGKVALAGGGLAIDSVTCDDAMVVVPDGAGNVDFVGSVVANGTNSKPLFSNGSVANTFTAELQIATANAGSDVNFAGICYFDDSQFTVDAVTGKVALSGGGLAIDEILTDDGAPAVIPNGSGQVQFSGGSNISITGQGPGNTVTIACTGTASFTWIEVAIATNMAVNTGYIANAGGGVAFTLPATAAQGSIIRVGGKGAGGWTIGQNAGQTIHFGNQDTTTGAGGSLASTNQYDSIELLCITANTDFLVLSNIGNITII